jgi:acetyltransferase-like isoleucine patch superfamily enzyme/coenzyme F420-reducing hydrogenase beta subunit
MINIYRKEECTGCGACVDICNSKAITFETDSEGFWYPKVNHDLCTNCGLCEKTCPELHIQELKQQGTNKDSIVLAALHKEFNIRCESTSGGLFSALANKVYDNSGYVGGAVYNDDFFVEHFLSNKREDLLRIRGSKHIQSDMTGFFHQVKELLKNGEKVLICAAPCQIAALRLYLGKEYENLTTVDFICLGINSPKIFHKHLESLERQFGAKAISVQGKNKDLGWRSLAYKIKFANNTVYLREGKKDNFTRGFISTHISCRPTCYECKYKGFPRISDITLGDFWGIENVDKALDDNMGTSVVLLNSQKGIEVFDSIKDQIKTKEMTLSDVLPGNQALLHPITKSTINRDEFYKDIDTFTFDDVIKKYYPLEKKILKKIKSGIAFIYDTVTQMGYYPKAYIQFLWLNFLRKNSQCEARKGKLIFPARFAVLDIHKQANISIKGSLVLGYKRIRGSRLETRLAVEGDGSLAIESGNISILYGTDILVFKGAKLTFKGQTVINQNVQIICMDSITIGVDVRISRDVVIRDNDGGHEIMMEGYKKTAPVIIGNHVWIGQGAIIMKGVTIGDGAVIAAGAWVATNVKPHALVMCDPARTVQKDIEWRE